MSDIQLFRLEKETVMELKATSVSLERDLQSLIETYMEQFLGVHFLASEYTTGKTHRGRIDSLGVDENYCPVIIEYKRHSHENVINQGLYYLDWLLDHQAEFRWLVMEKLGKEAADTIEWQGTRLLCIAADFTKYDQHAVQQIPRNIELIRYKMFGPDLLLLELVNTQTISPIINDKVKINKPNNNINDTLKDNSEETIFSERMEKSSDEIKALYKELRSFLLSLGDDVSEKKLKLYTAFRKLKNFVTVAVWTDKLQLWLTIDPTNITLSDGFSRDVSQKGRWGTGNVELSLRSFADLERAKPLLEQAYTEG
ncbi:DUF91 domain-containing protein [Eikenella sp. S3360]|uniref:DUF91 domain-containing protein n=1 Tax=Eikenella glucosivorans TaxID=2766967 RepID=A0ABS0N7L9_9NEIS|nr:DUF5655 domain-containing protein [Eikenella glucosivorans]MBH5328296.1 DUF91 domain-containing protein [Eikenella glucosivorans]